MPGPLIPEQRHERLLAALRREGVLSIRSLATSLDVSHMTVRRDIAQLEAEGKVVGVKGGVRLVEEAGGHNAPLDLADRVLLERPRKEAIARAAAEQIEDGAVVFLDAGTTTQAIVPHLDVVKDLTVVTSDFLIVNALFRLPKVRVIHTGGDVDATTGCAQGPFAAGVVSRLNIDTYFVSSAGWSLSRGVSSPNADKAMVKEAALAASARSILVADSTKYGASTMIRVFPLEDLDAIITDDGLSDAPAAGIRELGVDLTVVTAGSPQD